MNMKMMCIPFVFSAFSAARPANAQELKVAHLGNCELQSGQVIKECQLGYRTFGTPNPAKSNVIVFPTWASGRTEQVVPMATPGSFLDSSKYFIIAIDALANGVSSSPSNSKLQPRMQFPKITIHDMVVAEHLLLTKELRLEHVFAIAGMSMGGMQTFDWIVSYPTFMDKAITIVGSPKLASYDRILWKTEIDAIKVDPAWMGGNYRTNPGVLLQAQISALMLSTPAFVEAHYPNGEIPTDMLAGAAAMDANDHIRQAGAMMAFDVSNSTGGSMKAAAARVNAKVFVIVSKEDHTVTPQPALDFAKLIGAETLVVDSPCGHIMLMCEMSKLAYQINHFLDQ